MSCDHCSEKLDRIIAKTEENGKTIAAIDERTKQHEKRMDRIQAGARNRGGAAGAVVGGLVSAVLHYLGVGSGP